MLTTQPSTSSADVGDFFEAPQVNRLHLSYSKHQTPNWPEPPLPTSYWTLPINAQNRRWSTLASNWLLGSWLLDGFQTEGTAPTSCTRTVDRAYRQLHLPARAFQEASLTHSSRVFQGNVNDYDTMVPADNHERNNLLQFTIPIRHDHYGYYAVNLYTGQQLWAKNGTDNGLNNPYILTTPCRHRLWFLCGNFSGADIRPRYYTFTT